MIHQPLPSFSSHYPQKSLVDSGATMPSTIHVSWIYMNQLTTYFCGHRGGLVDQHLRDPSESLDVLSSNLIYQNQCNGMERQELGHIIGSSNAGPLGTPKESQTAMASGWWWSTTFSGCLWYQPVSLIPSHSIISSHLICRAREDRECKSLSSLHGGAAASWQPNIPPQRHQPHPPRLPCRVCLSCSRLRDGGEKLQAEGSVLSTGGWKVYW